jgi:hypothetical protein
MKNTEDALHEVLDKLAKIIDGKARDQATGDYIFTAHEWYAMHCLVAFAPERGERKVT